MLHVISASSLILKLQVSASIDDGKILVTLHFFLNLSLNKFDWWKYKNMPHKY